MLIPEVKNEKRTDKELFLREKSYLTISKKYYNAKQIKLFKELFHNFTARYCKMIVRVVESDIPCAVLGGNSYTLTRKELNDNDYKLVIDEEKVKFYFNDNNSFAHAFCTLLQLIEVRFGREDKVVCALPITEIADAPIVKRRMVHICVFAESTFERIRRTIREIGFYKYSHLVIEFWGMYKFKCNKNLYRKNAFSKKQVQLLVTEAKSLGVQVIPMINVWGHAAMNRVCYGKHTVLDNSLKMQPYFSKSGWEWNIQSSKTLQIHKQMIDELIVLCAGTEYFHIGCDEAYTYGWDRNLKGSDTEQIICDYINSMNEYIKAKGLKTLIWADMLLCNPAWSSEGMHLVQSGSSPEKVRKMIESLSKDIILVDWQYWANVEHIPTAKYLSEHGFEVVLASFDEFPASKRCVENVIDNRYYALMMTTWHKLSVSPLMIAQGGSLGWSGRKANIIFNDQIRTYVAAYLRKLLPPKKYSESGFAQYELDKC